MGSSKLSEQNLCNMIIRHKHSSLFAIAVRASPRVSGLADPVYDTTTIGDIVFDRVTSSEYHYEYLFEGAELSGLQCDDARVDMTEFPVVKRAAGVNEVVVATFYNENSTTSPIRLDFTNVGPGVVIFPDSFEPAVGSYAKFSHDAVVALCDGLPVNTMFDAGGNRHQGSLIPHAEFTGHVFDGSVGGAPPAGRRFAAVTPRHIVGLAHYFYSVGMTIWFKTVGNVLVSRTIQKAFSGKTVTGLPSGRNDFSMYLLNEDLPETIKPFPIAGPWLHSIQGGATDSVFASLPQYFGLILWNMDGHLSPSMRISSAAINNASNTVSYEGIELTAINTIIPGEGLPNNFATPNIEDWGYSSPESVFYHNVRGGDSGSLMIVPVADGEWALGDLISGTLWSGTVMNDIIALLDASAGISTGYTVTVAPDPTL